MDGYELMMALVDAEAPHAPRLVALPDLLGMLPDIHPAQLNGTAVRIEYEDVKGNSSIRWITIRSIDRGPPAKLNGHCWVKNGYRSLRADRILSVSDEFGESCSGEEFFRGLDIDVHAGPGDAPPRRSRKRVAARECEDDDVGVETTTQVRGQKKPLATGHGYTPSTSLKSRKPNARARSFSPPKPTEAAAVAPKLEVLGQKRPVWVQVVAGAVLGGLIAWVIVSCVGS